MRPTGSLREAGDPGTLTGRLRELAGGDYALRAAVAANPSAPLDVLEDLIFDEDVSVRQALAANPAIPPSVLLVRDEAPEVRRAVAMNPLASPRVVDELARDDDDRIRERALRHPNCPPEAIRIFSL